ncbi:MAG: ATP-grasp domain-containing protein [Alphaproteobacteria bacterium]|nr:ATP-grasp domain-containing protein [Alphaproteobacteria bacterium]
MFAKILIANRGEIAVRIARTARRMGVRTVAVFSDADAGAPHVEACDEAVRIGPAPARDSYLKSERIIEAATRTGAEAIHPGYGFLSENADFAENVEAAGCIFIGPTAETIRAMGSKSAAKDLMEAAGVPTTPGYQGADQSVETFRREAQRIGYPVLLKATAGGGGKGMRRVDAPMQLADAVASAQREGAASFGDDRLLIEKYIETARHVEVQIFGDGKGAVVHLFERDCSVQRRHQKIIEEAPAPNMPPDVRARLLDAGVAAGAAVDYRGAGTVEFLYDGGENVYFMEMNTRLQVEHPVTELITGVDLVEWQLRVAAGEPLPLLQDAIRECGAAVEARIYAEKPDASFAPSIGRLTHLAFPPADMARVDSGVRAGQDITPHYDPMIAKVIVSASDRKTALKRMTQALARVRAVGVDTNTDFLRRLASHPAMMAGDVSTRFIETYDAELFLPAIACDHARAALLHHFARNAAAAAHPNHAADSPWTSLQGFRLNKPAKSVFWIDEADGPALARVTVDPRDPAARRVELETRASAALLRAGEADGETRAFAYRAADQGDETSIEVDGARKAAAVIETAGGWRVFLDDRTVDFARIDPMSGARGDAAAEGSLTAPMPGVVTALAAEVGVHVDAGATLVMMEAMKMEHAIKAPVAGKVAAFRVAVGDQVGEGELLVEFETVA